MLTNASGVDALTANAVLRLYHARHQMVGLEPRLAQHVGMRFLAWLSVEDIAQAQRVIACIVRLHGYHANAVLDDGFQAGD